MIAFGCPITSQEDYDRWAGPSIQRYAEPDSLVIEQREHGSIQKGLNAILDKASAHRGLEAVILLHQDLELSDGGILATARRALTDPTVGIVGAAGARGVRGIDWWEATGYGRLRNPLLGAIGWTWNASSGAHDVDTVDGCLMIIAPWAARTVRLPAPAEDVFHGYDLDLCLRVRARGGRVMVDDIDCAHHIRRTFRDREQWVSAGVRARRSWDRDLWPPEWKAEW
ncbi:MAG TPA: glycosyltransferase [Thermoleophilaceae bacterium]|nr:glycosyltransferase [Thermoleophilaceae bacterium]